MNTKILNIINQFFEHLPEKLRKHRIWIWGLFILLNAFFFVGMTKMEVAHPAAEILPETEPVRKAYDRFRAQFGSDVGMVVLLEPKDGDILSDTSLRTMHALQNEILDYRTRLKEGETSPLDHLVWVRTINNVPYLEVKDDALISRKFIGDQFPNSEIEREKVRKTALAQPNYVDIFLTKDSKFGGMYFKTTLGPKLVKKNADTGEESQVQSSPVESNEMESGAAPPEEDELMLGDEDVLLDTTMTADKTIIDDEDPKFEEGNQDEEIAFVYAVEKILEKPEYSKHFKFHMSGGPVSTRFDSEIGWARNNMILMISVLLIFIILGFLFRSLSAVVWTLVIIISSAMGYMGIAGWTGIAQENIQLIGYLILVVGVADTVHIMSGYFFFRNQGEDHETAINSTYKKSGLACFLTTLTTVLGFLSLLFSSTIPAQTLGKFSALGVFLAFMITIFILPLMLDLWSPISKKRMEKMKKAGVKPHFILQFLKKLENYSYQKPGLMITVFLALTILFAYGTAQTKLDNPIEAKEHFEVIQDLRLIDRVLGGTVSTQVYINTKEADALKDKLVLNAMSEMQEYMEHAHQEEFGMVTNSLADIVKDTYKALNEGKESNYIIPQDNRVLAQTLYVFGNAAPEERRQIVSDDFSKGYIGARLRFNGMTRAEFLVNDLQFHANQIFAPVKKAYPNLEVVVTGQLASIARVQNFVTISLLESFCIALIGITIVLIFLFGSIRIGLLSLVPNLFPILSIFGVMGLFDMPLTATTLIVAPLIIGIVVDDSLHFLTHYRAEMWKHGNIIDSIIHTYREAGQAISFTSMILIGSNLVWLLSAFRSFSNFGVLMAIAVFFALLADLFLLPSILKVLQVRFGSPVGLEKKEKKKRSIPVKIVRGIGISIGSFAVFVVVLYGVGMMYQSIASKADMRKFKAPGKMIQVNDTKMHLYCVGSGDRTIVMDAGSGGSHLEWSAVQSGLAKHTRVCSYDRPGLGWSEPTENPRTTKQMVSELRTLLQKAGEKGPFVMVGFSQGGYNARLYAKLHPDEVSAIVLVNGAAANMYRRMPEFEEMYVDISLTMTKVCSFLAPSGLLRINGGMASADSMAAQSEETRDVFEALRTKTDLCDAIHEEYRYLRENTAEINAIKSLGDIPIVALSSDNEIPSDFPATPEEFNRKWKLANEDAISVSTNGTHIRMKEVAKDTLLARFYPDDVIKAVEFTLGKLN